MKLINIFSTIHDATVNEFIEAHLNTDGWFSYPDFYQMVANQDYTTYVEVGVWKGHSISYLANQLKKTDKKDIKIYAVDLFEETYRYKDDENLRSQVPLIYDIYNENLKNTGTREMIIDIKGVSWEKADKFEDASIDFVFIDADHEYESVVKDINAWLPKIKKGGMISGDDYFNPCGVKQAVDEKFGAPDTDSGVRIYGHCWYVRL